MLEIEEGIPMSDGLGMRLSTDLELTTHDHTVVMTTFEIPVGYLKRFVDS